MPKICESCGKEFPFNMLIDGKMKNLGSRRYCLECSPFGTHNTRPLTPGGKVRQSAVWDLPRTRFEEVFNKAQTQSEMLRSMGLNVHAANFRRLRERIEEEGLDIHVLEERRKTFTKEHLRTVPKHKKTAEELFVEGEERDNAQLKRRLVEDGLVENSCSVCGLPNMWNGQELRFHLDHINGNPLDNRIENLRLICPNCHSQTGTYCGRNGEINKCIDCGTSISKGSTRCTKCDGVSRRKTERPHTEILLSQIERFGFEGTGRIYGVSGNAIRKWTNN